MRDRARIESIAGLILSLLLSAGLELSGYKNLVVAIVAFVAATPFALFIFRPDWAARPVRFRWPITIGRVESTPGPRFLIHLHNDFDAVVSPDKTRILVFIPLRVTNAGADGSALDWTVNLVDPNTNNRYVVTYPGGQMAITAGPAKDQRIPQNELIWNRTVPLVRSGETVHGWYLGVSEPMPVHRFKKGGKLVIGCRSSSGTPYSFDTELTWNNATRLLTVPTLTPLWVGAPIQPPTPGLPDSKGPPTPAKP